MPGEWERRRAAAARRHSRRGLVVSSLFAVAFVVLYLLWPHWIVLVGLGVVAVGVGGELVTFLRGASGAAAPREGSRRVVVDGSPVELELAAGEAARELWGKAEPRVGELWAMVVEHTRAWQRDLGAPAVSDPGDFRLSSIDVTPDAPFEGGELVFWFELASDPDGTYAVPMHDDQPLSVHRDS